MEWRSIELISGLNYLFWEVLDMTILIERFTERQDLKQGLLRGPIRSRKNQDN